jgi:hypothetical protein
MESIQLQLGAQIGSPCTDEADALMSDFVCKTSPATKWPVLSYCERWGGLIVHIL